MPTLLTYWSARRGHEIYAFEQRDMALTIKTAAGSLLGLVDQVLDLAKIEARRFTVELESFDLHDSLARVRQMLGHLAAGRGLYLRLRLILLHLFLLLQFQVRRRPWRGRRIVRPRPSSLTPPRLRLSDTRPVRHRADTGEQTNVELL